MKKFLFIPMLILLICNPAWSLTIDGGSTDVGVVDHFLTAEILGNSGDDDEILWAENYLKGLGELGENDSLTLESKIDTEEGYGWIETDELGTFAFDFDSTDPRWFLVKTGNNNPGGDPVSDTFLFENWSVLGFGVIDLDDPAYGTFGDNIQLTILNLGKLSHIDEFNAAPVPEPATLLLLGTGLVGLAGASRKKFKK